MYKGLYGLKTRPPQPTTNPKQEVDRFVAWFRCKTSKILATKSCFSTYPCDRGPTDKKMLIQATQNLTYEQIHRRNVPPSVCLIWVFIDHSQWLWKSNDCHVIAAAVQIVQNQHKVFFSPLSWNRWPNWECKQDNKKLSACTHSLHPGQLGRPLADGRVCH